MRFQIRAPRLTEARALSDLAFRAKAHWGYSAEWLQLWDADLTLSVDYLRTHHAFVAESAGAAVGLCVLELQGDAASLEHVWIAPEHHRNGIGRALVRRALETAVRAGAKRVEVVSDPFAEGFYVRLGARRVREVPAPMPAAPERALPVMEFLLEPDGGLQS